MKFRLFLPCCLIISSAYGQFIDVNVQVNVDYLDNAKRQEVAFLQASMEQFFTTSNWGIDIEDLEIVLDVHLVLQSTVDLGGREYFQGQLVITNRLDQMFLERDARFTYRQGQAIILSLSFDPLATLLEYYAYLIIAGELDTYDVLGGSNYYQKAATLANLNRQQLNVGRSWMTRIENAEKLSANQEFRRSKALFYQAFDVLAQEKPNPAELRQALTGFYDLIEKLFTREGLDYNTQQFLTAHAEELAEWLAVAGMWDKLEDFNRIDRDNSRIYKNMLATRKK